MILKTINHLSSKSRALREHEIYPDKIILRFLNGDPKILVPTEGIIYEIWEFGKMVAQLKPRKFSELTEEEQFARYRVEMKKEPQRKKNKEMIYNKLYLTWKETKIKEEEVKIEEKEDV